ncbi:MAG TPA: hypothetical protein VM262_21670, partial [Acidimicrobiales bacterium]|nr:hypothetical protein [Acidimicrobiales bacterium]
MRRAILAVAIGLLGLAWSGAAGALDGDAPAATGWWSRDPSAREQPPGGFQIASLSGQPVSVAALGYAPADGTVTVTLRLQEADGSMVTDATALDVCTTTDAWEPANPGAYGDAPTPDCTSAVPLSRDAETLEWSAEVGHLVGDGASLMVVPAASKVTRKPGSMGEPEPASAAGTTISDAPSPTRWPTSADHSRVSASRE